MNYANLFLSSVRSSKYLKAFKDRLSFFIPHRGEDLIVSDFGLMSSVLKHFRGSCSQYAQWVSWPAFVAKGKLSV